MVEAEENLEKALRVKGAADREQKRRLRWIGAIAASYAVDTVFLGLFALAGTIHGTVPLVYGAAAASFGGGIYLAIAKGWNLKVRDPNHTEALTLLGIAMQLGVVLAAPQITFPYLANLFTVFAFGMIWLSVRDSVVVWTLGVAGTAVVFYAVEGRIAVPASGRLELALVWGYFSLILGRCVLLSVNANEMRARLADGRLKLAATLEQVQQLASRDELTGSLNRRSLMAALERERSRAERGGTPFSVGMIDLDRFKQINDTYGHSAGDHVLRAFAATVHDTMRITDVFGRYGGEEFLLILVGTTTAEALEAVERIRAAVAAKDWSAVTPSGSVTLSAGVATFRKGETIEQLLNRADRVLYNAKHAGRDRVIVSEQ